MLPSAPPSSRPSAIDSSVFRPELPWYQTIRPMTPIEHEPEQQRLVAEQPEQRARCSGCGRGGRRSPTIDSRSPGSSSSSDEPGLRQLVEDDDRRGDAEEQRASAAAPAARRSSAVIATRRRAIVDGRAVELDGRRAAHRPGARPCAELGQRVGERRAGRCGARPPSAQPSIHRSIRSSSSRPASRRRSWTARASSRASPSARSSGRQLGVEDHDQAVVVGDRRAGPRRGLDLDLVGARVTPASVTEPSASNVDRALAGGGHHRRDRRAEALADLRQQRLDPPLDEVGVVGDELDGLDVDLVGDEAQQLVVDVEAAVRHGEPGARPAAGASEAGLRCAASGRGRRRPAATAIARLEARRGARPGRRSASAVRWTLSGASGVDRRRRGSRTSFGRNGRIGASIRPSRRAPRGASRTPPPGRPGRPAARTVARDRRRYQVDRPSMIAPTARGWRPTASHVAQRSSTVGRRARGPRQDPAVERRPLGDRAATSSMPATASSRPAGRRSRRTRRRSTGRAARGAPRRRRASRTGCSPRAGPWRTSSA